MNWLEELPSGCPPTRAKDVEIAPAYRIVSCAKPSMDDYKSHAALKRPLRPGCNPCDWASCSLFTSRDRAKDIAGKLPKPRFLNPYLALLNIEVGDGKSIVNQKTAHVHFWASDQFDPLSATIDVERV